jgi:PilZ domain
MSATAILSGRRRVRRSKRIGLSVPVMVQRSDVNGAPFQELTRATDLNANGALLTLRGAVEVGQTIVVENQNTGLAQECRVVNRGPEENGKWKVGVEFTGPAEGFWEIYFPAINRGMR